MSVDGAGDDSVQAGTVDENPEAVQESPLQAWNRDHREKLEAKAAAERETVAQRRADAEEALDEFYRLRTNRLAQNAANHRNKEEEEQKTIDADVAAAQTNPWNRVCKLVDIKQDVEASGSNKDRFRTVIVDLKTHPIAAQ